MNIHRQRQVPRNKIRKPSAIKTGAPPKRGWSLGFSESSLNKAKLFFGVLIAIVALASGLLTLLKIYASDEATFKRYADQAVAWHYKTDLWNGYFSNWFEGMVNIEELNLSESSMALALQAAGNAIDGGMSEKQLCSIFPPQDFKLVRGTISHFGNSAEIEIFEFVGGRTTVYAEFTLHHDGLVLEVTPKRNSRWLGKDTVRLIRHPESTIDTGFKAMEGACKEEIAEHSKLRKQIFDRMVEKGEIKRRGPTDEAAKRASEHTK